MGRQHHNEGMRVDVVADASGRDGGFVAERLVALGAGLDVLDRDDLGGPGARPEPDLLLLLGSSKTAHDPRLDPVVRAETRYSLAALDAGVPVMAIGYGAQVLARALGGTSYAAAEPEIGWRRVDTVDAALCPRGPWAQFHEDVFVPPPTARVLGTSWYGPQCFVDESRAARAIAWQFHPEATAEAFAGWVSEGEPYDAWDVDPREVVRQARTRESASRRAAHGLVDAALSYLRVAVSTG